MNGGRKFVAITLILIIVGWSLLLSGRLSYNDYSRFFTEFLNNEGAMPSPNGDDAPPKLLLISYDGFRWDYLKRANAPNLKWLIQNGVHATEGLKNTFITITAPNHYGIVTGLYEESHGIIANTFFDPTLNKTFDYFTTNWRTDPRFFRHAQPVWVTNDNSSADRKTGCIMWVGCDIPIAGTMPQFWMSWNGSIPWEERVDKVVSWFLHPKHPVNFGILYIEEPDETGHQYGASSPKTIEVVEKLDRLTAYLLWSLYRNNLLDKVNMIFTADHGMADVPDDQFISLNSYINDSWYRVYGGSPNWNVLPNDGREDIIYEKLRNVSHMLVYKKENIPKEYRYAKAAGVMPLSFFADEHYGLEYSNSTFVDQSINIDQNQSSIRYRKIKLRGQDRIFKVVNRTYGEHGYNNSLPDMHPYFIGHGPAFKKGFNVTQFMNLDLYPLMCYILNIQPRPNNGSFERVRSLLADEGVGWPIKSQHSSSRVHDFFQSWRFRAAASVFTEEVSAAGDSKSENTEQAPEDIIDVEYRVKNTGTVLDRLSVRYGLYVDVFLMFFVLLFLVVVMTYLQKRYARQIPASELDSCDELLIVKS